MKITQLDNNDIKIECETLLDEAFWNNVKKERLEDKATIKSLKRNVNAVQEEISYLKEKLRKNGIMYIEEQEE